MFRFAPPSPLPLPAPVLRRMDRAYAAMLAPPGMPVPDFCQPAGEPALVSPDSLSWRIFKNPISLFIGGVTAVILELAQPGVRTGVWEHSSFRRDPVRRLQRTGMAATITVYSARSVAETMIAGVVRMHDKVSGETPGGHAYRANDTGLLDWVQATASYGFINAYSAFVRELTPAERDQLHGEAKTAARLYGATGAPASEAECLALFDAMAPQLEASDIAFEFLDILNGAPALPWGLRPLQPMLIRAAVTLTPAWVRERLGLVDSHGLRGWERPLVRQAAGISDTLCLPSSPAVQACLRLGLPQDYLYR